MPLAPKTKRRERILLYAQEKVGKTTAYLSIADATKCGLWVADSDNAYYANVEEFPSLTDATNHHIEVPVTWDDYRTWAQHVIENASPDDWVIVDRIDHMRAAAIDNYIETVYEQEAGEWFLAATREQEQKKEQNRQAKKKETSGVAPVIESSDWQIINGYYYSLLNRLNTRLRGQHIIFCASAKKLITDGAWANQAQINKYSKAGYVPEGGSKLGPIPSSILYMKQVGDNRFITTVGDRGREKNGKAMKDKRLNNFAIDYLMGVAGWQMV